MRQTMKFWIKLGLFPSYYLLFLNKGVLDKSLARPGRKQVNVSVRMGLYPSAPCFKKKT